MGNTKSKHKHEKELLQECKDVMSNLERAVDDLLTSLDLLTPLQKLNDLIGSVDKKGYATSEKEINLQQSKNTVLQLLCTAEDIENNKKKATIDALSKVLQFIKNSVHCDAELFNGELLKRHTNGTNTLKRSDEIHRHHVQQLEAEIDKLEIQNRESTNTLKRSDEIHRHHIQQLEAEIDKLEIQNRESTNTLKRSDEIHRQHIQQLEAEIDKLEIQNRESIKTGNERFESLAKKYAVLEQNITRYKKERNKDKTLHLQYQQIIKEKDQQINKLNKLIKEMEMRESSSQLNLKDKQESLDMLRADLKEKENLLNDRNGNIEVLRNEILEKEKLNRNEAKYCYATKLQLMANISTLDEEYLREKTRMEKQLFEAKHACGEKERHIKRMEQEKLKLKEQFDKLKEKNEHACGEKERHIKRMEQEQLKLEEQFDKLKEKNELMRKEMEKIKSRNIIQVQLYSQSTLDLISSIDDKLIDTFKSNMDQENIELDFLICGKASDIQPDIPLLILCIQTSSIESVVASNVRRLPLTPKMALLIFHHKDEHALPNHASERVLTGEDLRRLGGIFDLACLQGKGVYPCEMNRNNFVSLSNFIRREGKKRSREDL